MNIVIDLSFLERWSYLPIPLIAWQIFLNGGWIIFLFVFFWMVWQKWLEHIQAKFEAEQKYVLLAIDVPRDNEQGPEAVERLFAHLAGIKYTGSWFDRNFRGYIQPEMSFELISLEGQIQFLVRTPVQYRDLVEAAIYTTYPNAMINEVEDYSEKVAVSFPNEEYDLWGADLVLYNDDVYPIRTYPFFEHPLTQELKDPLGNLLEILSKFGPGEQAWLQLIISPLGLDWGAEGERLVQNLMKQRVEVKVSGLDRLTDLPVEIIRRIGEGVVPSLPVTKTEKARESVVLSPGERRVIEAIQGKLSKIAFEVKFRIIYLAKKEIFSSARGVAGILGAINQFNTLDMNGFKPSSWAKTSGGLIFAKKRLAKKQNDILEAYRARSSGWGGKTCTLNIEELASIYHFPVSTVKAPLIKKTGSKRGEPPFGLPIKENF